MGAAQLAVSGKDSVPHCDCNGKMDRTKVYRIAQEGEIPASKIANQLRLDREEIDDWLKRQRPATAGENGEGGSR